MVKYDISGLTDKTVKAGLARKLENLGSIGLNKEPVEIQFCEDVKPGKLSSLWYGDQVASVSYLDYSVDIIAAGATILNVTDKKSGKTVFDWKDESRRGLLGSGIEEYLGSDDEIYDAEAGTHPAYDLYFVNNNWHEMRVMKIKANGFEFYDTLYSDMVLDDSILDAVVQAAALLPDIIDEIKQTEKEKSV